MSIIDWIVLSGTLFSIVAYGVWKTRKTNSIESYLLGDRDLKWWTIGLSIMATQASAITFLSTPGQAYDDGMRFAQFYFGLPIAMVILSIFVLPIYYKLKVYTAYEYLEGRFDRKTRTLTAILFLISRGLAAGLTIFAPAIILSTILGWNLYWTNLFIGFIVIFYTVVGGTKAVSQTQKQQMIIILSGMIVAFFVIVSKLPTDISFNDAVSVAGKMGKLNVVDFEFDLSSRYNIWSGLIGGVFLFLSYFGTDQSQVQRYLSGKSLTESRLGLMFNGLLKVPMQFLILFVGIMVFMFYQFNLSPIHYNNGNVEKIESSAYIQDYEALQNRHEVIFEEKQVEIRNLIGAIQAENTQATDAAQVKVKDLLKEENVVRAEVEGIIEQIAEEEGTKMETNDKDYVFITFVMEHLPVGLIGLLLAVIFSAAMSSTASELNALATTTVIDIYKRSFVKEASDSHYLKASRGFTIMWGMLAICFAMFASLFDNLIEAVNIVGSLFYGTILGIFLTSFFLKWVKGNAIFIAAVIGELIIVTLYVLTTQGVIELAYLWLNLIGCVIVMGLAILIQEAMSD